MSFYLETMLTHIQGIIPRHPEWSETMSSFAIEASWRLGRWESLDYYLEQPNVPRFETMLGQLISSTRTNNICPSDETTKQFYDSLKKVRETLIAPLAAASMESYRRAYDVIVKLHMIREVETVFKMTQNYSREEQKEMRVKEVGGILTHWNSRLDLTTPAFRVREPILNLRRIILQTSW